MYRLARTLAAHVLLGLMALSQPAVATAVTIDWVEVVQPGNACDTQAEGCFGAVANAYRIGRYEVTNRQYAEFLNASAASDLHSLYHTGMGIDELGGITRTGSTGSFSYAITPGRGERPVNFVSFYDALRFANWMHNGQGAGDTETGAYTITAAGIATNSIAREPAATIFLPSEDEWYKAAYYDPVSVMYLDYPAGSSAQTSCSADPGPNRANCENVGSVVDVTDVGHYAGSASRYGTYDQGGNVAEFNEEVIGAFGDRGLRGGEFSSAAFQLAADQRSRLGATLQLEGVGFRLAAAPASSVPEPGPVALLAVGWATLARMGRRR